MLICVSSRMAPWDLPSCLGSGLLWPMVSLWGFPGGSIVKNLLKNLPALQETWEMRFDPWVGKIPWRGNGNPLKFPCPEKSHGQRSLVGCDLWGQKESVGQDWATEHAWFHFICEHETSGPMEGQCASLAGITRSIEVLGRQGYSFHKFMACSFFSFPVGNVSSFGLGQTACPGFWITALVEFSGPNLLGLMAEDSLERGLLLKGGDGLLRRTTGIASLADVYWGVIALQEYVKNMEF